MHQRRWTRKTNAFSKSISYMTHAMALFVTYYNFGRKHMSLGTTPAIAAGVAASTLGIDGIVAKI